MPKRSNATRKSCREQEAQLRAVNNSLGALCGDTSSDLRVTARDALRILRSSVGLSDYNNSLCDMDSSGMLTTTDALLALRVSTGLPEVESCPACED